MSVIASDPVIISLWITQLNLVGSLTYKPIGTSGGPYLCATAPSDASYITTTVDEIFGIPPGVPDAVRCGFRCTALSMTSTGCVGFNYWNKMEANAECQFFTQLPSFCNYTINCIHYEIPGNVETNVACSMKTSDTTSLAPTSTDVPTTSSPTTFTSPDGVNGATTSTSLTTTSIVDSSTQNLPPPITTRQVTIIGCYRDEEVRDLSPILISVTYNTLEFCTDYCFNFSYAYAGAQNGESCLCGNAYGIYGTSNGCTSPCTGNQMQICGGPWANLVILTGFTGVKTLSELPTTTALSTESQAPSKIRRNMTVIGCYADKDIRDLQDAKIQSNANTLEYCAYHCFDAGYTYAGAQFGVECFCGDKYGTYGTSTNCDMPCSGNDIQMCGGSYANTVMFTGYGYGSIITDKLNFYCLCNSFPLRSS